jgi:hypothetical protein
MENSDNGNYFNHNPDRLALRGEDLPALLLGATFIDLRTISRWCRGSGLAIEFYQQMHPHRQLPSRFFVGRDYTDFDANSLPEGMDYRIELCESIPEHQRESLQRMAELCRNAEGGISSNEDEETVITLPEFRIYRFEPRPPFSEEFICRAGNNRSCGAPQNVLHNLIMRFVQYHDLDVPGSEIVRAETGFLYER